MRKILSAISPVSQSSVKNRRTGKHSIEVALDDRRNKKLRDPDAMLQFIDESIKDKKDHYIILDEGEAGCLCFFFHALQKFFQLCPLLFLKSCL